MSGVVTDPAAWVLIAAHVAALLMLHPAPVPQRLRDFVRARTQAGAAGRMRPPLHVKAQ